MKLITKRFIGAVSLMAMIGAFGAGGAPFGSGSTAGDLLTDAEAEGMTIVFDSTTPDMLVRGSGLNYNGTPFAEGGVGGDAGKLSYTGASLRMKYNSSGVLEFAGHNLILQSQTFDNVAWGSSGLSGVTANDIAAPDGTTTADKITYNATSGNINQVGLTLSAGFHRWSIYLKKGNRTWVSINAFDGASHDTWFDLDNIVVGTNAAGNTSSIEDAGSGWRRCIIARATTATANGGIGITVATADGGSTSVSGDTLYLWGAQIVRTPCSDTNYYPTVASAYFTPRYDYNPTPIAGFVGSRTARGLLIEEARTNLALRSQEFTNAAWAVIGVTAAADGTVAPDGTTTADSITESGSLERHVIAQTFTVATNVATCVSVYLKNKTGTRHVKVQWYDGTDSFWVYVNPVNGTITDSGATTATLASASIQDVGNGWYRVTIVGSNVAGTTSLIGICLSNSATEAGVGIFFNVPEYTGDGTSGVWVWGAQREDATFATSYIPTTSASVTRAADDVRIATALFPYSTTLGTGVVDFHPIGSFTNSPLLLFLDESGPNDDYLIIRIGNGTFDGVALNFPDSSFSVFTALTVASHVGGVTWQANDVALVLDGGTPVTDSSATLPDNIDLLRIGSGPGTTTYSGHLKKITYLPRRATNTELQRMTRFGYLTDIGDDLLGLDENEGMAIDFTAALAAALIRDDVGTLNYNGDPFGKLSFTGASLRMKYNSIGVLEFAGHNFCLQSQTFDTGTWSKFDLGVTANATPAPDGTQTADALTPDTDNAGHRLNQAVTLRISAGNTFSAYLKKNGYDYAYLFIDGVGTGQYQVFNLNTGALGATGSGTRVATITDAGNGWWRCSLEIIAGTTAAANLEIAVLSTDSVAAFAGDGTSGIFAWGAQLNVLPCSDLTYYPTVASAVFKHRLDYNPATLAARGLLVEEQRVNLVQRSQEADNAYWTKGASTISANAIAAPDSTTTADKIVEDTATTEHNIHRNMGAISGAHTWSVFVKAAERTWCRIGVFNSTHFGAHVNLATGALGTVDASTSAVVTTLPNGWYRIAVTATLSNGSDSIPYIHMATGDAGGNYLGDGASGLYVWGMQLEAGAFPTSYIPTTSASVTRAADQDTITTSLFPYSATEGTLIAEAMLISANGGTFQGVVGIGNTSAAERIQIYREENTAEIRWLISDNSVVQNTIASIGTPVALTPFKAAIAWKANDVAAVMDGGTVATDTSVTIPTMDTVFIGNAWSATVLPLNGWIRKLTHLPRRMIDADLDVRTAA